jgi:hypothetical protein
MIERPLIRRNKGATNMRSTNFTVSEKNRFGFQSQLQMRF